MTKIIIDDMTYDEWVLDEARKRDPKERAAFLDKACRGNPALRAELDSLLRYADTSHSLIDHLTSHPVLGQKIVPLDNDTCPACKRPGYADAACKHCGYGTERSPLISGVTLEGGKYRILRVLGTPGGFGITYLARHKDFRKLHAIKEYLPVGVAIRKDGAVQPVDSKKAVFEEGRDKFVEEAQTLEKLSHPNIMPVSDVFQDNGTAYIVMPYYKGQTLSEYLHDRPMKKSEAVKLMIRVLDGLKHVHKKKAFHLDVKPSNIYLKCEESPFSIEAATPILIDFGAARFKVDQESRKTDETLSQSEGLVYTPGYSPPEQRDLNSEYKVNTWSDTYACMATVHCMVTGRTPAGALKQGERIKWPKEIFPCLGKVLTKGLAERPHDRYRDAQALQKALRNSQRCPWIALLTVLFVALAVGAWLILPTIPAISISGSEIIPPAEDVVLDSAAAETTPPGDAPELNPEPDPPAPDTSVVDPDPPQPLPEDLIQTVESARAFYNTGLMQSAAEKFYEAAAYVDTTTIDRDILGNLVAAKSRLGKKEYRGAADLYYAAFEALYPKN